MKRIICSTIFLFTILSLVSAQKWGWNGRSVEGSGNVKTEKRDLSNFDAISVSGGIDLYIHPNSSEKVEVKADDNILEMIFTEVSGGTLKIYSKGSIQNPESMRVDVWVDNLERLAVSGGTDTYFKGTLKTDHFKLVASGGSDVTINIEAKELILVASGSSDINMTGSANYLRATASGSSDLKAYDLAVKKCKLKASGSSDAYVSVSEELDLSASGSSDVHYRGDAKITGMSVSGSSDVHH